MMNDLASLICLIVNHEWDVKAAFASLTTAGDRSLMIFTRTCTRCKYTDKYAEDKDGHWYVVTESS